MAPLAAGPSRAAWAVYLDGGFDQATGVLTWCWVLYYGAFIYAKEQGRCTPCLASVAYLPFRGWGNLQGLIT